MFCCCYIQTAKIPQFITKSNDAYENEKKKKHKHTANRKMLNISKDMGIEILHSKTKETQTFSTTNKLSSKNPLINTSCSKTFGLPFAYFILLATL